MSGRPLGRNRSGRVATASTSKAAASRGGKRTRVTTSVSYAEDSDSFEEEISASEDEILKKTKSPSPRTVQTSRRQRATSDASPDPRKRHQTSRMAIGQPRPANNSVGSRAQNRLPRNLPPWPEPAKVPYDVLLNIFQYAAYPLIDKSKQATSGAAWLVKIALLRRDFLDPAMSALYFSPPLEPASRIHRFFRALNAQTESSLVDYRRKVRFLEIEIMEGLIYKYLGRSAPSLLDFVVMMPQLQGIRLNLPGARRLGTATPPLSLVTDWYGEPIMQLFEQKNMKMANWNWNYALGAKLEYPWRHMKEVHQRACFRSLKHIEIARINGTLTGASRHRPLLESLSSALGELEQLESLTISDPQRLTHDDTVLIFQNARPLTTISFVSCDRLTSECLEDVLATNGSALHHLILNHNRALDVSFLSEMRRLAPLLRSLRMDLTFHSDLGSVNSTNPLFKQLLRDGCTPQWPQTLQHLELIHLRKWDARAASTFLTSLVDAALDLLDLRYLALRMSVDADWRDRIKFRDVWEERIVRVFKRRSASPRRWSSGGHDKAPPKKSVRQAMQHDEYKDDTNGDGTQGQPAIVNGTCDRVLIRIENLRPMETLLMESDFLDAEKAGDGIYGH